MINNLPQTFLADESCDFAIIRALRAEGFDVVSVAESYPALFDENVFPMEDGEDVFPTMDRIVKKKGIKPLTMKQVEQIVHEVRGVS